MPNTAAGQHWRGELRVWQTHPTGESKRRRQGALIQGGGEAEQPVVVGTLGGLPPTFGSSATRASSNNYSANWRCITSTWCWPARRHRATRTCASPASGLSIHQSSGTGRPGWSARPSAIDSRKAWPTCRCCCPRGTRPCARRGTTGSGSDGVKEEIHAIRSRRGQHHPLVQKVMAATGARAAA